MLAVVAVVVAVLLVLAVVAHDRTSSSSSQVIFGTPFDYDAFAPAVATADLSAPDGPWTPLVVEGLGVDWSAEGTSSASDLGFGSCDALWVASGTFVLPGTASGASEGDVALWVMFSSNSAGDNLVSFANDLGGAGVAAFAFAVLPSGCLDGVSEFEPGIVNQTVVDSTTVVAKAASNGGSDFLASHSVQTTAIILFKDYWGVEYSTCSFGATSGTGVAFLSDMYATNATAVADSTGTTSMSC